MAWYGNHLNIYFNVFVSICCYRGIRNTSSSVKISTVTAHEMQPGNRRTDRRMDNGVLVMGPILPFGYRAIKNTTSGVIMIKYSY